MLSRSLSRGKKNYTNTMIYINLAVAAVVFIACLMELAKRINKL